MPTDRVIEYFGLRSKLKFDIENAQIWLDENRMVLVHAEAFSLLRDELHSILVYCFAWALLQVGKMQS
jgi:two-component system response regulator HydG